jgi:TolB-like protein/Tfp pilus assembly protein PilF/predicted Ser/Thr protein kinase
MESLVGKTIAHYHIIAELGRGGRGVVYRADDTKLVRPVALKFLSLEAIGHDEDKARFLHEAQFAGALNHPSICTVHEIDETDGRLYIVMEYIEGRTLEDALLERPFDVTAAVETAIHIAEGLREAHEQGVVHRDIKSANVMLTSKGLVKITDFGLAKSRRAADITRRGTTLGTVAYMSPEQVRGEDVDQRTDIWSLGVILYEMLTGRRPFGGEYEQTVMYSILHDDPEPPSRERPGAPHSLDAVVRRALAKDRDERYHTAAEMLDDLYAVMRELAPAARPRGMGRRGRLAAVLGSCAAVAAAFVIWKMAAAPPGGGQIESIAVLPLDNIAKDPEQEYVADGMTEAIITELSKIKALRVISKTSVERYRDTKKSLPEIARELGVDAVIEGSTQLAGKRVRVTAQLIEAKTDRHLWADSHDRDLGDVLVLQKEVAQAIAREIRVVLSPAEARELENAEKIDARAQDLYLRGRFEGSLFTRESQLRGIELFEQALEIEPRFALACAGIAGIYDDMFAVGLLPGSEAWPKVRFWAQRALEIDPTLAEAHTLLADVQFFHDWDFAGAERSFKRAIESNPGYSIAHCYYGNLLLSLKRREEAMREYDRALALDPLGAATLVLGAYGATATGDLGRARELGNRLVSLFPQVSFGYAALINVAFLEGNVSELRTLHKRIMPMIKNEEYRLFYDGLLALKSGEPDQAKKIVDDLRARGVSERMGSESVARLAAQLGDADGAFDWIERGVESRQTWIVMTLNVDPMLAPLRADPRFPRILRAIGLP